MKGAEPGPQQSPTRGELEERKVVEADRNRAQQNEPSNRGGDAEMQNQEQIRDQRVAGIQKSIRSNWQRDQDE